MNIVEHSSNEVLVPSDNQPFKIISDFKESGDQPSAINALVNNIQKGEKEQVLLGVTGSGKTFTMAKVIESLQRPTLIMAPNKTLAAQLYGEMKSLFPKIKWNILLVIMIITRLRLMFLAPIPILKKNHPLMNKSIVFDILQQDHWWREEIQLLLPLSHAFMELDQ